MRSVAAALSIVHAIGWVGCGDAGGSGSPCERFCDAVLEECPDIGSCDVGICSDECGECVLQALDENGVECTTQGIAGLVGSCPACAP